MLILCRRKMKLIYVYVITVLISVIYSDTTVTIYPEWWSQGGRVRYDSDRWNKHNGLDKENLIPSCRSIRTDSGRWINRDYNDRLFQDWPEDPARKGYPDPSYLRNVSKQQELFSLYLDNIDSGYRNEMVMMASDMAWPNWMDKSEHKGQFPNNVDAAAEFFLLMVQGIYDYTQGKIPPYLEPMNEPDSKYQIMNFTTVALFHRAVADKLHSRFNITVSGPTLTGYSGKSDTKDFSFWKQVASFIDININHLDTFNFHSYNSLIVSGKSHRFSGMNEARLVAFVDLVENYYNQKIRRVIPLVISEYGRGPVIGLNSTAPSGIIDFATVFHSNAHRFTQISLREYVDRSVLFVLANEKYPGHDSLNWSLFTLDGKPTRLVDIYKFWYNFTSDYRYLRTSSSNDGKERLISPLVLSNPEKNETVILLHSYTNKSMNVQFDFKADWIVPSTAEAMCVTLAENWYPEVTYKTLDLTKSHGIITMLPEATCQFRLKTVFNPKELPTVNETTYYGTNMVIPITDVMKQTVITLPDSVYHTARLRVSVSLPMNSTKRVASVSFNSETLNSFYMYFDSDKLDSDTYWNAWEYSVPPSLLLAGDNMVKIYLSNNETGGYVSSVALVTGKLVPDEY